MNKQPFYHRLTVLFTATEDVTDDDDALAQEIAKLLKRRFGRAVLKDTVEIEEFDAEPGDPADLL